MAKSRGKGWVVAGLVALTLVPAVAGTLRLVELAGGPALIPEGERYGPTPWALMLHIVSAPG